MNVSRSSSSFGTHGSSPNSGLEGVVGFVAVAGAVAAFFLFPVTSIVLSTLSLTGHLLLQAMKAPALFTGPLWQNLLLDMAFGATVGLLIGLLRYGIRWKNGTVEKVISAAASRKVLTAAQLGLSCALVHIVIGAASGFAVGLLGMIEPPQLWMGKHLSAFRAGPAGSAFLAVGLMGGGGGGPPPFPGFFISVWLAVILAALILSILFSMFLTVTINSTVTAAIGEGLLSGGAKGLAKRAGVALTTALVRLWYKNESEKTAFGASLLAGFTTGALTGGLTACISLVCIYVANQQMMAAQRATLQVTEIGVLSRHKAAIRHLVFSPDNHNLLSNDINGDLKLWDVQNRKYLRSYHVTSQESKISSLNSPAFSPGAQFFSAGGDDGTIHLWTEGRELRPSLISNEDRDTLSYEWRKTLSTAFSPDGKLLAAGFEFGSIQLWDLRTLTEWRDLAMDERDVIFIAFVNGDRLIAGDSRGYVKLWDLASGAELDQISTSVSGPSSFQLSADGKFLGTAGSDSVSLSSIDVRITTLKSFHHNEVTTMCFQPGGGLIASGARDGTIRFWSFGTGLELRTITAHEGGVTSMVFSPDGQLLVSGGENGEIKLWSVHWE